MELIYIIGVVCAVYLSTNMDNLLCLIGFFSNRTIQAKHVFAGWFVGSLLIVAISLFIAYAGTNLLSDKYIGLLGVFPIIIGIKGIYSLYQSYKTHQKEQFNQPTIDNQNLDKSHVFTGAAVTLANGGDNISAYAPLFLLARTPQGTFIALCTFFVMTASFSVIGYFLVRKNKYLGQTICHYGTIVLPFVLIFLGTSILYQSFWK